MIHWWWWFVIGFLHGLFIPQSLPDTHRHTGCRQQRHPSPQIITQVYDPFNPIIVDEATSLWWPRSVESKAKATTRMQYFLHEKQNKNNKTKHWCMFMRLFYLVLKSWDHYTSRPKTARKTWHTESVSILAIFFQGGNHWLGWSACALREKDVAHD